ncbi:ras association domain-containing protein 9 isoform X2 [Xenopus laevis]|nr:ras association domain-containing protein 9 isoform X2 [Xenopus laevis]XP_041444575.1 ras association domain-containing protein 9 isoform X2 [Xenopus laevis]
MENEESQIVVWAGQEEKIVLGLTKHTTCADIVQALLEDHDMKVGSNTFLLSQPSEYFIVEKWRGFERVLPPPTKILKLWRAWGKEQSNLNFVLVKSDAFLHIPMWKSAEAKITHNIDRKHLQYSSAYHIKALPLDKRKRIIRKAFRKLTNLKKDIDFQDRNNLETLLHVIMSQEHTIKQQIQRIEELNNDIESKEANLHLARVENIGKDYVQNLYLKPISERTETSKKHTKKYFVEEKRRQEEMFHLEEKLSHLKILINSISTEIEAEITSIYLMQSEDQESFDNREEKAKEHDLTNVKEELDESLQQGLQLHDLFECIQEQIRYKDSILLKQEREYKRLEEEFQSLCISNTNNPLNCQTLFPANNCIVNKTDATCDFTTTLCNMDNHETDSDTGISSGISQDSEPAL